MEEETEKYRAVSLEYCQRLLREIKRDREDAKLFFGGEIYKSYAAATDKAVDKAIKVQTKIRHL